MARNPSGSVVGIREVARIADVSPSTVSRVLNGKVDKVRISDATVERVRQAAITLRYQPNAAARSLRTSHTQTIGVIARNLLQPFAAELLRVIYTACRARGYYLLLGHAEHNSAEGEVLGSILSVDRVDGVLLMGDILPESRRREDMEWLIETHSHVVTVGARPSVAGELSILVDDSRGVALALEHLVALGHRSIGYISQLLGPESWEDQQRRLAYRHFLRTHDLPHVPAAEVASPHHLDGIQEALRSLLALPDPPTALFVTNDVTALMTVKAASTCGIRVPDDLSIVGFDDIPFSALSTPGLTTVHQPIEAMGQHAASALLDRIAARDAAERPGAGVAEGNTLFFPPTLVCRESASAPAHGPPARETTRVG